MQDGGEGECGLEDFNEGLGKVNCEGRGQEGKHEGTLATDAVGKDKLDWC